ncbi:MAG: metalloregulator ArsR/SmtB family transcription factor [Actinobacteria bacterium]|jgi:ArsR family transcriptional regulator, arsenate/arsenite/antimonite-responsive transcriptional repressor|nr:metalloregulator ArsR/SmtB family transcription factor [Actinomycetota bacterium]
MSEMCCSPLLSSPLSDEDASELATVLKALADPVRLKLVSIIAANGEGCACDFPGATGKSQPTISHHLSQLVKAGILQREQRGKWAWFRVDADRLASVRKVLS